MTRSRDLRYGPTRHQRVALGGAARGRPNRPGTIVVVHGGFWAWPWGRVVMTPVVRDLRRRGWWTANVEYRRLGRFGGGGGYPATFDDVVAAAKAVAAVRGGPIVLVGHSAGAHLSLCAAPRLRDEIELAGVVAVAPPTDLRRLVEQDQPRAVELTRGVPDEQRWETTSPIHMLPIGVPVVVVHSTNDATVPLARSSTYVDAALEAGDPARLATVDGEAHRDALRPSSSTWRAAREAAVELIAHESDRRPQTGS